MQVSHILTGTKELFRDGARIPGIVGGGDQESHVLALRIVAAASEAVIENPEQETEAYRIRGRPTDRALLEAALEAGIRQSDMEARGDILDRFPFEEGRKYSAAILRGEKKNMLGIVGAPEVILAAATTFHIDGHPFLHYKPFKARELKPGKYVAAFEESGEPQGNLSFVID